ncbi:MAG: hypothetical protein AB4911_24680 [Oscillochloridaceae bacterium umkhey_bin13]
MYEKMVFYLIRTPFARAEASEKPASPHPLKSGGLWRVPHGHTEPTLLGLLQADELAQLRKELQAQIATGTMQDNQRVLPELQQMFGESLVAADQIETLQQAFEVFLCGKTAVLDARGGILGSSSNATDDQSVDSGGYA